MKFKIFIAYLSFYGKMYLIIQKEWRMHNNMLQIKGISKTYKTGDMVQKALNNVSLNLRDNEFVAILGPSGSGKTTLLNIIGGLDRYEGGDLIINSISTKKYTDRDWDSYRNHTIGFVFQSYNLIPHQTILSNVELALTISGVSKAERKERAKKALEQVGLGEHIHKKPNQMSGGQMQRVAIARALVNNPDVLLADEPTGALDTETSIQVMELLKEVAKDKLVVMVTHNPELAEQYATRIVRLTDGNIISDTEPFEINEDEVAPAEHKNMGKSVMSFFTSLSLSFNNLKTKKARTFLTAFAGSIGIIGIALILSLSNGVNNYIEKIQKDTMTSYPILIEAKTFDLSSFLGATTKNSETWENMTNRELDKVYVDNSEFEMVSSITTSITENNLTDFKKYLDNPDSKIHKYIGDNGIIYSYAIKYSVFSYDPEGVLVNTDGTSLTDMNMMGMAGTMAEDMIMTGLEELLPGKNGQLINPAITKGYDVIHGSWPDEYNEMVLVVGKYNQISAATLYKLGVLPASEYKEIMAKIMRGEEVEFKERDWSYEEMLNKTFYMIPNCDKYFKNENGTYTPAEDISDMKKLLNNAIELKISGIVRANDDADITIMNSLAYTRALTDYVIEHTNNSEIVKAQMANDKINVISGVKFAPADDATKIADTKIFLQSLGVSDKAKMFESMMAGYGQGDQFANMTETELALMFDQFMATATDEMFLMLYNTYISAGSYEDNIEKFGVISYDAPTSISIYVDTFEDKEFVADCIAEYNKTVSEENKINYTDYIAILLSSVTTIIDVISYVLIAFVSVSLVVSSIMIGIITYISVLERTKEIGILRAIGASKKNISQVFNAETFIIGLFSGILGIAVTWLVIIPANMIIHSLAGTNDVSAALPLGAAIILVILSVVLTLIGGFIPAKKAAKKDPVTALRTE